MDECKPPPRERGIGITFTAAPPPPPGSIEQMAGAVTSATRAWLAPVPTSTQPNCLLMVYQGPRPQLDTRRILLMAWPLAHYEHTIRGRATREIDRRDSVYEEAPGFRLGPHTVGEGRTCGVCVQAHDHDAHSV